MRCVKVQYDGYNRQFTLIDRELARELEDGGTYLIADFSAQDFLPVNDMDLDGDRPHSIM